MSIKKIKYNQSKIFCHGSVLQCLSGLKIQPIVTTVTQQKLKLQIALILLI